MPISNPALWEIPLGADAEVREIPQTTESGTGQASFTSLFPLLTSISINAGGIPPNRLDFNGLFKLIGDNVYFMQRGGQYQYDATIPYEEGAVVTYNGYQYRSLQDDNQEHAPGADTADYWELANVSPAYVDEQPAAEDMEPNRLYLYPAQVETVSGQ